MADDDRAVAIEVAYATPSRQCIVELTVPAGTRARDAALLSRLDSDFTELDLSHCAIGIFGRRVDDDQVLRAGDRVELYRPLQTEPRDARRRRAGG